MIRARTAKRWLRLALLIVSSAGCDSNGSGTDGGVSEAGSGQDAGAFDDDAGAGLDGGERLDGGANLDGAACGPDDPWLLDGPDGAVHARSVAVGCALRLSATGPRVVEMWVQAPAELALDDTVRGSYLGPLVLDPGEHRIVVHGAAGQLEVRLRDHGSEPGPVRIERSLTWTDGALLDDPAIVGLGRVLSSAAADGHGGRLLDQWFRRFATTAHSERLGPQRIVEEAAADQGGDPAGWDLDALPFRVTAVHNRIDLGRIDRGRIDRGQIDAGHSDAGPIDPGAPAHCGELRVSLASTHPLHQPFHLIALYRQEPTELDLRPDGSAHCAATALRWARLSELDRPAFHAAARAWLDEALRRDRFLALETLEFIISPWEWRQWFLEPNEDPASAHLLPEVLDDAPLFQTVDTARLNQDGPDRDAFLAWVGDNAAELSSRRASIPERFRSRSARVNDGVAWIPLDLRGLSNDVTEAYPDLRQQIEIVGCPACHATDADFVQTRPDRTFSPFYASELDARAVHLEELARGLASPPPHGPLQPDPLLPP